MNIIASEQLGLDLVLARWAGRRFGWHGSRGWYPRHDTQIRLLSLNPDLYNIIQNTNEKTCVFEVRKPYFISEFQLSFLIPYEVEDGRKLIWYVYHVILYILTRTAPRYVWSFSWLIMIPFLAVVRILALDQTKIVSFFSRLRIDVGRTLRELSTTPKETPLPAQVCKTCSQSNIDI